MESESPIKGGKGVVATLVDRREKPQACELDRILK